MRNALISLLSTVEHRCVYGIIIRKALKENRVDDILPELKEACWANRTMMYDILGFDLLDYV
jgi:hypothetical protein